MVWLEENIDRNRMGGVVQKEDAMSTELTLIQTVAIELVGDEVTFPIPCPGPLASPLGPGLPLESRENSVPVPAGDIQAANAFQS